MNAGNGYPAIPFTAAHMQTTVCRTAPLSNVRATDMTDLKRLGIVDRCMKNRIYIVATNDRDLKRRLRKIPGVPILSVGRGKYVVERLPDSFST